MLDLSSDQYIGKSKMQEVPPSRMQRKNQTSQVQQQQQWQLDWKHIVTVFFLISYQIGIAIIYGLFFKTPSSNTSITSLNDAFSISLILLLSILGFGLIFGYYHRLGFTGIGFNLFIAAFAIQTYFIANLAFNKIGLIINDLNIQDQDLYKIYLSSTQSYQGTMKQAVKCALSCIIAFSCVIGRVGILQTFFITIFGAFGYQFNRQICLINNDYDLGTFKIFGYGAGIGLTVSLLLKCNQVSLKNHQKCKSTPQSQLFTLLGMCLYFFIFPLLVQDQVNDSWQIYQVVAIIISITISGVCGIIFSLFYGGQLTFITCSLAGGIAVLSTIPYIRQTSLAFLIGGVSAIIQYIVYIFDKWVTKRYGLLDPLRYVFFIQGALGTLWGLMAKALYLEGRDTTKYSSAIQFLVAGWISIGIGIGVGLFLSIFFNIILYNQQYKQDYYFQDNSFWILDDGIKTSQTKEQDLESQDHVRNRIISKYEWKEYSRIKQTHSIL